MLHHAFAFGTEFLGCDVECGNFLIGNFLANNLFVCSVELTFLDLLCMLVSCLFTESSLVKTQNSPLLESLNSCSSSPIFKYISHQLFL